MKELAFDGFHIKCVKLAQSFIYTKSFRKDAIYFSFYSLESLFRECAKRLHVSQKQFRMLMSWELQEAIEKGELMIYREERKWAYVKTVIEKGGNLTWFGMSVTVYLQRITWRIIRRARAVHRRLKR